MTLNYRQEFNPISRIGQAAALYATTLAYYSLRVGIIVDWAPIEGKGKSLRMINRIINKLLSSPITASLSAGGFAGSAVAFALAAGLFLVLILSGATEADFISFMPLSYYLVAVSLFMMSGTLFGGLGGVFLGMIYSEIASYCKARRKLFGVIVSALIGGLIGEVTTVIIATLGFLTWALLIIFSALAGGL